MPLSLNLTMKSPKASLHTITSGTLLVFSPNVSTGFKSGPPQNSCYFLSGAYGYVGYV